MVGVSENASTEVCDRLKNLGYGKGNHIQLYGERFEIISDPFLEEDRISICVRAEDKTAVRFIKLPVTVFRAAQEHHELRSRVA